MNQPNEKHAVVIGASMAGLLAAKALSNHFPRITIFEKDKLVDNPLPRKNVPQGNHLHALLKSGEQALEAFFPGIIAELLAEGAQYLNVGKDVDWLHHGKWKVKFDSKFHFLLQSRPFLEWKVRKRIEQVPSIQIIPETKITAIKGNFQNRLITETTAEKSDGEQWNTGCDVLVDASGAGSNCLHWLKELGYQLPQESTVSIDLAYNSRIYEIPKNSNHDCECLMIYPNPPHQTRLGSYFPIENNRLIVTLGGYGGVTAKKNENFLEDTKILESPKLYETLRNLTPIGDVAYYKFPKQRRRHFEKVNRLPGNFIIVGDALCRFDPVFGQGMSVAAKEATALNELLKKKKHHQIAKSFYKKTARIIDAPWLVTSAEAFRFSSTTGKKPVGLQFLLWYVMKIFDLTAENPRVYLEFIKSMHLVVGPVALFKPYMLLQVAKLSLRQMFRKKTQFAEVSQSQLAQKQSVTS